MSLFSTITVCTDFSPGGSAAVERAVQIAVEHHAALCVLQVFNASASNGPVGAASAGPSQRTEGPATTDAQANNLKGRLSDLAVELAQRTGLKVDSVFKNGVAYIEIIAYIQSQMPSLVVIGSRFDPTTAGLGGTALKLLGAPECPVLVVRKSGAKPYLKLMSGVDLRDGSVRSAVAALTLFPNAHHHLLYAIAPSMDGSLEAGGLGANEIQTLLETRHQHAEHELNLLAQGLSAKAVHRVAAQVANDVPSRALMVGVASLEADCVAVGHHDETTIGQTELGSIASHVVQFIPSDVLVVP